MILYNVTVKVDEAIHPEWLAWMKKTHIPDVLATGHFVDHKICRLLSVEEEDGPTYAIQYFCNNLEAFRTYQEQDARRLQKEHMDKYGNRYVAFRTLMEVVS